MQEILEVQGIKSLLSVPIFKENTLVGFSGFDSVKAAHDYSSDEIEIIRIFGEIFINLTMRIEREKQLKNKIEEVRTLNGLLPICSSCKKIRDDKGYWQQLESYIESRSEALFSHGLCPDCMKDLYGDRDWYREKKER